MRERSINQYPSAGIMAIILISLMYSFGTFGFLNLFGARSIVQATLLGAVAILFILMRFRFRLIDLLTISMFSIFYVAGSIFYWGQIGSIIDAYILVFCIILLFRVPPKHIIFFSKVLVVATTILCLLVAIASTYYTIYPSEIHKANIRIYDSMIGHAKLNPGHFIDFISFTSGDGFEVLGRKIARMKGYSNEPSSTMVHYVAPAVIAFLLGGRYVYLGLFILFVNVIAIGSFMTYIALIIAIGFFFIKFIPRKLRKMLLYITIISFLFIVTNQELIMMGFIYFGNFLLDFIGFDLILRKIAGESDTNLSYRHIGIVNGFTSALSSPFGYFSGNYAGGLLGELGSRTGWFGLLVFGVFLLRIVKNIIFTYNHATSWSYLFGVSLIIGILLVTIFISAYGWLRPAGIIMLLLYFRFLEMVVRENNSLPKFGNRKFFI